METKEFSFRPLSGNKVSEQRYQLKGMTKQQFPSPLGE